MEPIVQRLLDLSSRIEDQLGEHGPVIVEATIRSVRYDGIYGLLTLVSTGLGGLLAFMLGRLLWQKGMSAKDDDGGGFLLVSIFFYVTSVGSILVFLILLPRPQTWRSLFDPLAEVASRLFL